MPSGSMPAQRQSPSARAQQFGGVEPAGLGVVGIHVRDGVRLGLDQRAQRRQDRSARRPASRSTMRPKPATRCAFETRSGRTAKSREAGEQLGLRLAREIARRAPRLVVLRRRSPISITRAPSSGSPSLRSSSISETRRIGQEVLGVHRERRDQQQRRAVGRGRDIDQRTIGIARSRHQRRQRAGARLAQQLFRGRLGIEVGIGLHVAFHRAMFNRIAGSADHNVRIAAVALDIRSRIT